MSKHTLKPECNLSMLSTINHVQSQYRAFQNIIKDELNSMNVRLSLDDILIMISIHDYININNKSPSIQTLISSHYYSKLYINYSLKNLDTQNFIQIKLSDDPIISLSEKGINLIHQMQAFTFSQKLIKVLNDLQNNISNKYFAVSN